MQFRYGLDERPSLRETLIYGLQWFAVTIPIMIIIGKITGGFHFSDAADQMIYLQKLTFVMAVALAAQIMWGHRMPLIIGPSTVLLIGIIAAADHHPDTIYSSVMCGGILLSIISMTGFFGHLKKVFTARVVSVVLLLIAFTLTPTIINLITATTGKADPVVSLTFSLSFVMILFFMNGRLTGIWKSTLIVWGMAIGSIVWFLINPESLGKEYLSDMKPVGFFFKNTLSGISLEPGVMISFMFCFLALLVNDLGSIQSMNELLKPSDTNGRVTRGVFITGVANVVSGLLGVIGPVNFSLSPGVIAATGCASRITMIPTAALLLLLSFSPAAIGFLARVPSIIIGGILIYILTSQIAAGLLVAYESIDNFQINDGLIIGLPLLLATIISFLPVSVVQAFPVVLKPILGNGFVVGISAALLMENVIFRK
jgi:xanthine/uracil permease